jgi:hypothetical protein
MSNPFAPSDHISLNEQLLYRIASLDASVREGFRRVDERLDRFQSDIHENQIASITRINEVDTDLQKFKEFKRLRVDGLEKRIGEMETWSKVMMARVGILITTVAIIWTVLGPTIRTVLGISNG